MAGLDISGAVRRARIEERNRRWFPKYRRSWQVYLEYAQRYTSDQGMVFHLGAGRDSLGLATQLRGQRVVSVDVDQRGLVQNSNQRRVVADVARLPFADGSCEVALLDNVFEHLTDREQALREAYRVLADRGWLIFLCPNRLSYISVIGKLTPRCFHVWLRRLLCTSAKEDTFETYYRLNTPAMIRRVARRTGFAIERLESYVG